MNLLTDENGVLKAMVEMEGLKWLGRQRAGQFNGFSIFEAIEKLKDGEGMVVYGQDGWNRYAVRETGEVEFIGLQAVSRAATEKARRLGFTIL